MTVVIEDPQNSSRHAVQTSVCLKKKEVDKRDWERELQTPDMVGIKDSLLIYLRNDAMIIIYYFYFFDKLVV